jgi:hypothetical protein
VVKEKYQEEKAYDDRHDDDDDDDDDYDDDNTIYGTKRAQRQSRYYVGDGFSENCVTIYTYFGAQTIDEMLIKQESYHKTARFNKGFCF